MICKNSFEDLKGSCRRPLPAMPSTPRNTGPHWQTPFAGGFHPCLSKSTVSKPVPFWLDVESEGGRLLNSAPGHLTFNQVWGIGALTASSSSLILPLLMSSYIYIYIYVLITEVPSGDVLIHCGDLTNRGSAPELQEVNGWLEERFPSRPRARRGAGHGRGARSFVQ